MSKSNGSVSSLYQPVVAVVVVVVVAVVVVADVVADGSPKVYIL